MSNRTLDRANHNMGRKDSLKALCAGLLLVVSTGAVPIRAQIVTNGESPASSGVAGLSLSPCHLQYVEELAKCGTLDVPENHADPDGKKITLNIAILPPSGGQPTKEPLYFLAGGPGQAATEQGELYDVMLRRIRRGRDLVLIDQRGTGKSNPFQCVPPENPLADGASVARACLSPDTHHAEFYTSDAFIKDLDMVRAALGHEQISLMGISYGTRAALLYAKAYEARVRAMVLDSVAPPHVPIFRDEAVFAGEVLSKTIAACADDQDCAEAFPQLTDNFSKVLSSLEAAPASVTIPETDNIQLAISRDLFLMGFRGALYSPPGARLIPFIVTQAARGNYRPWLALTDFGNQQVSGDISLGLLLSVQCAEEIPLLKGKNLPAAVSLFPSGFNQFWKGACEIWPTGNVPEGFNDPVSVSTPTLLISGGLDPITPPQLGDAAAEHLQQSRHVIVPYAGHSVIAYGCTNRVVAQFLDDLDIENLDTTCLEKVRAPAFLTGRFGPKP